MRRAVVSLSAFPNSTRAAPIGEPITAHFVFAYTILTTHSFNMAVWHNAEQEVEMVEMWRVFELCWFVSTATEHWKQVVKDILHVPMKNVWSGPQSTFSIFAVFSDDERSRQSRLRREKSRLKQASKMAPFLLVC